VLWILLSSIAFAVGMWVIGDFYIEEICQKMQFLYKHMNGWHFLKIGLIYSVILGIAVVLLFFAEKKYIIEIKKISLFALAKKLILSVVFVSSLIFILEFVHYNSYQKRVIDESNEFLSQAETNMITGDLKAANNLINQTEMSLKQSQKIYELQFLKNRRKMILEKLKIAKDNLSEKNSFIQTALNNTISFLDDGKILDARDFVNNLSFELSNEDSTVLAISRYLDKLISEDFKGVEDAVVLLKNRLDGISNFQETLDQLFSLAQTKKIVYYEHLANIVSAVISLSDDWSKGSYDFTPILKGRAIIWDYTKNAIDSTYGLLADDIRASPKDNQITIFLIKQREWIDIERLTFSVNQKPGYKERVTIEVIYWPQKINAGKAMIWGEEPRVFVSGVPIYTEDKIQSENHKIIVRKYYPPVIHSGYGPSVDIKKWIEELPRKK